MKSELITVGVRFYDAGGTYVYLWDLHGGEPVPGMLGLVDSPFGGLKCVEILWWRPGIDERITKDLLAIGEVPVISVPEDSNDLWSRRGRIMNRFSVLDLAAQGCIPNDSEEIP